MNTKWVGIVLLGGIVSTLSLAARTVTPSYLNGNVVGFEGYTQWSLGTPGSTWQDWTNLEEGFQEPSNYYNPYVENDLIAYITDFGGLGVNISVPNVVSSQKTIWFEVVYQGSIQYSIDDIDNLDNDPEDVLLSTGLDTNDNPITDGVELFYEDILNSTSGWKVMTLGWTVKPSPSMEWFTFYLLGDTIAIQSISIDTLSHVVPAPGAVVLAGLGAAIAGYFRRKY